MEGKNQRKKKKRKEKMETVKRHPNIQKEGKEKE